MSTPSDDKLAQLRQRVASHPSDLQYRFELGAALLAQHDFAAALLELQKAQSSPRFRWPAMKLMVDLFEARGMREMATRMREQIAKESGENGDAGSAPIPIPTRPIAPLDSSRRENRPHGNDHSA